MSFISMVSIHHTIPFAILFLAAITSINFANAYLALTLRNRARPADISTTDDTLYHDFRRLQSDITRDMTIAAIFTSIYTIYGALKRLLSRESSRSMHGASQAILCLVIFIIWAVTTSRLYGFWSSFIKSGTSNSLIYYAMIYHGIVAMSAYGSFFLLATILAAVHFLV